MGRSLVREPQAMDQLAQAQGAMFLSCVWIQEGKKIERKKEIFPLFGLLRGKGHMYVFTFIPLYIFDML